jgi:hypothetical protein
MNGKYRTVIFILALLTAISPASLAQERLTELTRESFNKSRILMEDGVPFERVFPHLKLEKVSKEITSYEELGAPDSKRWSFRWDVDGFLIVEGKKTFIQKQPNMEIFSPLKATPDRKKGLLDYGTEKFAVLSLHDENITILPAIIQKYTSVISWFWKTNDSLIGVAYESSPKPNRYPETDTIPEKIFFFLYEFNDDGNKMYYISNLPKTRRGTLIRLEGITPEGGLVLAEVAQNEAYWGGGNPTRRILGVFDIVPPQSKSK